MSYVGIAVLFAKFVGLSGAILGLTTGTERFYAYKWQPKTKRRKEMNEDVAAHFENLNKTIK